jgi:hypothetical protein
MATTCLTPRINNKAAITPVPVPMSKTSSVKAAEMLWRSSPGIHFASAKKTP